MNPFDEVFKELRGLGYTDEKLQELLSLVLEDVQDELYLDLASISNDEELEKFKTRLDKARTKSEVTKITEEMAKRAYGEDYKKKIEDMTVEKLKEAAEMTKGIRKTYNDYMAGDPATRKKVQEMENSPEYKDMLKQMEDAGFDFMAEAGK